MRKTFIISSVIFAFVIGITSIFVFNEASINKAGQEDHYETHIAFTHTKRVGGLIPYNVRSDLIIAIPEDFLLNIYNTDMTYDELVSEIGEPSGTVGSGIIRHYWRIGENKYAVCFAFSDKPYFEIWNKNGGTNSDL